MDTGPFFSSGIAGKNQTLKGLSIKLGTNASVCFDTELMRMSYGWTGDFFACQPVATAWKACPNPSVSQRSPVASEIHNTINRVPSS